MKVHPFSVEKVRVPTTFTEFGKDLEGINLAGCENCYVSQKALEVLRNPKASWLIDHWQSQDVQLRKKLSEIHGVDVENIFLTSGAIAGIDYALQVFVNEKTRVGLLTPDFPGFVHYAQKRRAQIETLRNTLFPFTTQTNEISNFLKNKDIGFAIFSNPNAIIGTLRERKEIEELVKENPETMIVVDEADSLYPTLQAPNITNEYKNTLFLGSFSKFYGLSGLRIGYLITPATHRKHFENTINPAELTSFAIVAATASLEDKAYQNETQERVQKNLSMLEAACKGTSYKIVPNSRCFATYLWADKTVEDPATTLAKRGIDIVHGYGQIARGGRVNIADTVRVEKLREAIKDIFK